MPQRYPTPPRDTSALIHRQRALDQNPNPTAQDEAIDEQLPWVQNIPLERTADGSPIVYPSGISPMEMELIFRKIFEHEHVDGDDEPDSPNPQVEETDMNLADADDWIRRIAHNAYFDPANGPLDDHKRDEIAHAMKMLLLNRINAETRPKNESPQ
jgi:hypothetical protein